MSQETTKKRLEEQTVRKFGTRPNKYILCITTPEKAYIVEGRKDFTQHNNREATMTAWFEFLLGLTKLAKISDLNRRYRLSHFPPYLHTPESYYGLTMQHLQDGTICFGGRLISNCADDNQQTTLELISYFEEIVDVQDDEVRAHLSDFGFGIYEQ
jgi:hypothetical protein